MTQEYASLHLHICAYKKILQNEIKMYSSKIKTIKVKAKRLISLVGIFEVYTHYNSDQNYGISHISLLLSNCIKVFW